ncbi:PadR family transcriptional regulator [Sphaerisporangium krabiense]|uniref:DNA-binding PadR family transcriptional regulator n=1 Tax=Sphaerisporangium krabiense TaxID=763782 RepID=A0A7W8Z309_9ACTN|nr:PadR family transcriptional regulator [Sphaerisporangium krabiense]MBB5626504.1 DNA-binding PadR family transcriptional regulator [Sphaerisporangium krabiense]GII63425.1 PadR family transcriptional regulator [Sphaerisporangium krabiense]
MARRRADRDLTSLTVLALLSVRPSHPYELHRFIVETHKDYVTGLPRSLYHAVDRLVAEELIGPVETTREGRRPERTVYEITAEGRAELGSRLKRLLEDPESDGRAFVAAISLVGCLSPEEARRALRTRAATLEGMVVAQDAYISGLTATGLPPILLLEVECVRALRAAELDWVRGVLARLESGELGWTGALKSGLLDDLLGEERPPA